MKKQVLAVAMMTAASLVGANSAFAESQVFWENEGSTNSPFVIKEIDIKNNTLKTVFNGVEDESVTRLGFVQILSYDVETHYGREDRMDDSLPSMKRSEMLAFGYRMAYLMLWTREPDRFHVGMEETIVSTRPLSGNASLKIYYGVQLMNTQDYVYGKIDYARCAESRAFEVEEMVCRIEDKSDGSGVQYQPYIRGTDIRVEVPEDYDVPEPEPEPEPEPVADPGEPEVAEPESTEPTELTEPVETVGSTGVKLAVKADTNDIVDISEVNKPIEVRTVAAGTANLKVAKVEDKAEVAQTEVETSVSGTAEAQTAMKSAEVLSETTSLDETEAKEEGLQGWTVLVGVLGAFAAGWLIFLLVKRRKKDEEETAD